jgi:hypothetical protein
MSLDTNTLKRAQAAVDASIEAALAYRPPERTFPPLEDLDQAPGSEGGCSMSRVAQAFEQAEPVEDFDNHRNAPRPDPACLYGLVGEIAKAGSETTEANPYAIAAAAIAYLGVAVGRGPYMSVGNTWHHARSFMLHVGRSGEGRKGDAVSLIKRIAYRVRELSEDHAPQTHTGGLSSREGLVFLIHDGYKEGKEEVPAIEDKRLLVVESEFVNVLHQGKRDGNTLSAALRDCWDGVSLKPATKSNRLWASNPHVGILAAITPGELRACIASRDLTNGFANRFLPYWAERTRLLPFPKATPAHEVDRLAQQVLDVLEFCQASRWVDRDVLRVDLSPEAASRWAALYKGELSDRSHGERINALIERRAPMLLRLAMLFALSDCTATVGVQHINAALAWIRYSVESVKFIFGSAQDEHETREVNDTAQKILAFVSKNKRVTRTQLTRDCFQGNVNKTQIDAALGELLTANPPGIVVHEERTGHGRPTKFYTPNANELTNFTNNKHPCGFADSSCPNTNNELNELRVGDSSLVRMAAESTNQAQTRMDASVSSISLVRSADSETDSDAEVL